MLYKRKVGCTRLLTEIKPMNSTQVYQKYYFLIFHLHGYLLKPMIYSVSQTKVYTYKIVNYFKNHL